MKSITPSARMSTWHSTPASAESNRLADPVTRRRSAAEHLASQCAELQADVDRALAGGAEVSEILSWPRIGQRLRAARTASRELRLATALLTL